MKRSYLIIIAAIAVYALSLGITWLVSTDRALSKTEKLLTQSERVFLDTIGDWVDAILLHTSGEIVQEFAKDGGQLTDERLRGILKRFMIDEINIVNTNGVCIASSVPDIVGHDFHADPETEEFMVLLKGEKYFSQPFRMGTVNVKDHRKYLGVPYDGVGFIQLGMNFNRVAKALLYLDHQELRNWRIGSTGYYDFFDFNEDGRCDYSAKIHEDGKVTRVMADGKVAYARPFSYAGFRFISVLPAAEYFSWRNLFFRIMAPVLAVVTLFLMYFVITMTRASAREQRHRAAEDLARKRDLGMARTIQLSALPSPDVFRKNVFSFSLEASTHPAREVGGDFYDFYPLDKVRIAVVMADVSGKGISAAMFMMTAKNEIYNAICAEHDLAVAVENANAKICGHNDAEMFVTAWIGVLDVNTGEMEYVNAGHDRPFIRRADGKVEKVPGKGCRFLGMFPDASYRVDHLVLNPGDTFFLFTDGITEAMNAAKKPFGESRLIAALSGTSAEPGAMISSVNEAVHKYTAGAEQSDDLTSLALAWHGVRNQEMKTFAADESSLGPAMEWLGSSIKLSERKSKARILNASDEIMTNIVNYSGAKDFAITIENAPGRVRVTFTDSGREYNPLSHVDPDTHLPLADRPIGGLGILMTKKLVDSVIYRREDGRNILVLVKFDS